MSRRLAVVTAGLSEPSSTRLLADQLSDAVRTAVTARGEALDVDVIELRELGVALAQTLTTGGLPTPAVVDALRTVAAADGLVAVTPVFAASYSGLFKMFFDVAGVDALEGMPVLVAATAGTARHSLVLDHAMRPLFAHLRAVVVPTGVFAATEDFGGGGEAGATLAARVQRAAGQLAALIVAEPVAVQGFTPSPEDSRRGTALSIGPLTPFADLLRGHDG
ncbi:Predicted flavoprotein [Nostocoides japonicum T1-X7]|uniref:Predicted flavoprotein n=1 Tax=Nostocoides japonicum T1-X7 TaxID=1194083 RepID=A0A077LT81_9MICO|nr:FMN reductase [Tetrasphaera japonica]CCH76266.1 Predicted flavoprotein [Tetrasphaera japonica T1-X7]